jgi:lipoate-protein ligase A
LAAPYSSSSSSPSSQPLFEVERFRPERRRVAVVREVGHPTLVLGSTQPTDLVSPDALRARSVELVRRRGGGGAVYLGVGGHLWLDAWIPRDDVLWAHDVSSAAEWVGQWWIEAFTAVGAEAPTDVRGALSVHRGRSVPGTLGDLVCFAGRGPGEVFVDDRKIVGLSQWRSREGALFSSCAYLQWDPEPLLDLLSFDDVTRRELAGGLRDVAVGVGALLAVKSLAGVGDRLVRTFPGIGLEGT